MTGGELLSCSNLFSCVAVVSPSVASRVAGLRRMRALTAPRHNCHILLRKKSTVAAAAEMERDDSLLAIARANLSKRKFQLTLEQLCLQTIAKNEVFIVTKKGQTALLDMIPLALKSRLLSELSRPVFGALRYPAPGKHRVAMVKLLINQRLEKFDFAVLGNKFGKVVNQQVWQYLVEKASQSLISVQDLRITSHPLKTRSMAWCLPFVAKLPKLEELHLSTLCCVAGELKVLSEVAPRLKSLQILMSKKESIDIDSLKNNMKLLKEFVVNGHSRDSDFKIGEVMCEMPQLKIAGVRTDEPVKMGFAMPIAAFAKIGGQYNLEHLFMAHGERHEYAPFFKEVRHLLLEEGFERDRSVKDYFDFFNHLHTLNLRYFYFSTWVEPTLKLNGSRISSLILDILHSGDNRHINLCLVLEYCKNLSSLVLRGGKVEVGHDTKPLSKDLPFKKLALIELEFWDPDFLSWAMHAPLLEELVLDTVGPMSLDALTRATVATTSQLENLKVFKMSFKEIYNFRVYDAAYWLHVRSFAESMLAFSPNLQSAEVDLQNMEDDQLLKQLLNYVNA